MMEKARLTGQNRQLITTSRILKLPWLLILIRTVSSTLLRVLQAGMKLPGGETKEDNRLNGKNLLLQIPFPVLIFHIGYKPLTWIGTGIWMFWGQCM